MTTPACIVCGYDRAGLRPGSVCPECGSTDAGKKAPPSAAASRAITSLGLGALAWLGLIGLGLAAVPLGIGAVVLAVSALQRLAHEPGADRRPTATAIAGLLLGVTGTILGLGISLFLAGVYLGI